MPESRICRVVTQLVLFVVSSSSSEGGRDKRDGADSSGSQAAFTAAAAVKLHAPRRDDSPSRRAVDIASLAAVPHTATPGDDDVKRAASRDRTKQHPVVGGWSSSSRTADRRTTASERQDVRSSTSVRTRLIGIDVVIGTDTERLYELMVDAFVARSSGWQEWQWSRV